MFVIKYVSGGPKGSLAAIGLGVLTDLERRRQVVVSVEGRGGSAKTDCDREDGPAGSLAGTDGKARSPADCDLPSGREGRGFGAVARVLDFEVGKDPSVDWLVEIEVLGSEELETARTNSKRASSSIASIAWSPWLE